MSVGEALFALACGECGWRPASEVTMGVFKAHVETEHPDTDANDLRMDMVVVCPRDNTVAPLTRSKPLADGRTLCIHDCPTCHRTYRVTMNGAGR